MDINPLDLFRNVHFWVGGFAWLTAQLIKMLFGYLKTKRLDFDYLVSTGGMPSAHSSCVSGFATSIGLAAGFGSEVFMVAFAFAIIVMFDASTVRRAAGHQARILNKIVDELKSEKHVHEGRLKELLGHTRLEVIMGCIIGILVSLLVHSMWQ